MSTSDAPLSTENELTRRVRKPWVAPRTGGYSAQGPAVANPQPPKGPGAVAETTPDLRSHTPYYVRLAGVTICEECSGSGSVSWADAHPPATESDQTRCTSCGYDACARPGDLCRPTAEGGEGRG